MNTTSSQRQQGSLAALRDVAIDPRFRWGDVLWLMVAALAFLTALPAAAQTFPALSGRVVDGANILSPETETRLTAELEALERQSQRQLVVATVADLQGYDVADYGYRLGREWGIGDKDRNDGVLLLIAPNERKMHIAVGYGLEPVLTDALSAQIIRNAITPKFRESDFDGGVSAGVDAIARQITLPPEEAQAVAAAAAQQQESSGSGSGISFIPILFFVGLFVFLSFRRGGKRYRSKRGGVDVGDLIVWGSVLSNMASGSRGGGGFGGFSGGGGGGFGGFSGGGGSFGGGGASGGW